MGLETIKIWTEKSRRSTLKSIFKENLTNREIVDKYNPTPMAGRRKPSGADHWKVRNLTVNTIYGGPTDIDWALTLAYYSSKTKIPPGLLYPFGKLTWTVADDCGTKFIGHMKEYGSDAEVRAIAMAKGLLSGDVNFSDMFPGISENPAVVEQPLLWSELNKYTDEPPIKLFD